MIHLASAAVNNALWDMYARSTKKPLWKLVVDMTPEELVRSAAFRYISDAISKEEALAMLKEKAPGKKVREEKVRELGQVSVNFSEFVRQADGSPRYPAYVTSAGWLGSFLGCLPQVHSSFNGMKGTATRKWADSPKRRSQWASTTSR